MSRQLTQQSTLENLKKESRQWLEAVRAGDEEALVRLKSAYPNPPARPVLRDLQHALAREFGLASWTALKQHLKDQIFIKSQRAELVDLFLESACSTPIITTGPEYSAR